MRIYTKTGDDGETGLFAGPRVSKDDTRIEAYGEVDELNAFLGQAISVGLPDVIADMLIRVQHDLFAIGAELATLDPVASGTAFDATDRILEIEAVIDALEEKLTPLKQFILPGGTAAASALHVSRGVCRRAERRVVTLARTGGGNVSEGVLRYLNRLSDMLFVMSRWANAAAGCPDVAWSQVE
jgi:cob(I)alamin adenosyltransferase